MARNYVRDLPPEDSDGDEPHMRPERSIRDFKPSAARVRLQATPRGEFSDERQEHVPRHGRRSRVGVWIAVFIAVIVLGGAAALVLLPSTTITVIPRTHVMPFDTSMPLTAYPSTSAAPGTIPYAVTTQVFEDSAVVAASGTERAEEKATGTITIYNETERVTRLIKNTRFQTAAGLIYRIPASVDVPAAKSGSPGTANVTVFADQTGPAYNIGPTDRFTLPGLKSSPDYTKVYAQSTVAFTGGFSGERPAVSAAVLDAARAEVRGRLNEKAHEFAETASEGSIAFPGLMAIQYETLPPTNEPGGGVRIHERASVTMPVFPIEQLASSLARAVSADAEGQSVSMLFSNDILAQPVGELTAADIGNEPLIFTLSGRGQIIWNVDAAGLSEALAGKEESAFETIVKGFPSVEEARARITPFWKKGFPDDAAKLKVRVEEPPVQF